MHHTMLCFSRRTKASLPALCVRGLSGPNGLAMGSAHWVLRYRTVRLSTGVHLFGFALRLINQFGQWHACQCWQLCFRHPFPNSEWCIYWRWCKIVHVLSCILATEDCVGWGDSNVPRTRKTRASRSAWWNTSNTSTSRLALPWACIEDVGMFYDVFIVH